MSVRSHANELGLASIIVANRVSEASWEGGWMGGRGREEGNDDMGIEGKIEEEGEQKKRRMKNMKKNNDNHSKVTDEKERRRRNKKIFWKKG